MATASEMEVDPVKVPAERGDLRQPLEDQGRVPDPNAAKHCDKLWHEKGTLSQSDSMSGM